MSRRRVAPVLWAAVVLAAAGCSGGDSASSTTVPSTTVAATVATSATTTAPPTSPPTTAAPATVAPVTTAPTTLPPTTAPPTLAAGSVEEQVVAAALESWRLLLEAYRDPTNDEKVRAAGQAHGGVNRQTVIELLADFRLNNQRSTPNPAVAATVVPYPGEVVVDSAAGTASVTYCEISSDIVVETNGNPDGTDRVVNDEVNAYRIRIDLELVDGRWLDSNGELLMTWTGATACPDLSAF